jgi:hypothetical protein
MMLALSSREEQDPKTLGELFYVHCDEIEDIRFAEALLIILETLGFVLAEDFLLTDEQIHPILGHFFNKLPNFLQKPLMNQGAA